MYVKYISFELTVIATPSRQGATKKHTSIRSRLSSLIICKQIWLQKKVFFWYTFSFSHTLTPSPPSRLNWIGTNETAVSVPRWINQRVSRHTKMAITFYNETMSKIGYKRDHLRASMRLRQYQVSLVLRITACPWNLQHLRAIQKSRLHKPGYLKWCDLDVHWQQDVRRSFSS